MSNIEIIGMPLTSDQKIIIGRPVNMPDKIFLRGVLSALERFPYFIEAHLPQYFLLNKMDSPRLILAVIVRDADIDGVAISGRGLLEENLSTNFKLDMMVLGPQDHLLPAIQKANCRLK